MCPAPPPRHRAARASAVRASQNCRKKSSGGEIEYAPATNKFIQYCGTTCVLSLVVCEIPVQITKIRCR